MECLFKVKQFDVSANINSLTAFTAPVNAPIDVLPYSSNVNILPVLDLVKKDTDTPQQERNNGGGLSLENLCIKQGGVLGFTVDVERGIEKYGLKETVSMSAIFTVNQLNFDAEKFWRGTLEFFPDKIVAEQKWL